MLHMFLTNEMDDSTVKTFCSLNIRKSISFWNKKANKSNILHSGCKQLSSCLSGVSDSYRQAANSYPPAYLGSQGLQLMFIGLWLGCPQSHHVLYNTMYNKVCVLYTILLDVGEVAITLCMCICIVRQDYTGADFHLV